MMLLCVPRCSPRLGPQCILAQTWPQIWLSDHPLQKNFWRCLSISKHTLWLYHLLCKYTQMLVFAPIFMWECCKNQVYLEASKHGQIHMPVGQECRTPSRPDLHKIKVLSLCFLKIPTRWNLLIRFGAISTWSWLCFVVMVSNHNLLNPIEMGLTLLDTVNNGHTEFYKPLHASTMVCLVIYNGSVNI